MKCHFTKFV
jgi:hypothetical protein